MIFDDFYDKELRLALFSYLRPEMKFKSVKDLLEQINKDIALAKELGDCGNEAFDDYRGLCGLRERVNTFIKEGCLDSFAASGNDAPIDVDDMGDTVWARMNTQANPTCGGDGGGI